MIWSNLAEEQQKDIVGRFEAGEKVETLAEEYELLAVSLDRKMRLLRPSTDKVFSRKVMRLKVTKPTKTLVYSDTHFGNEDSCALAAVLRVAEMFQPELIVNLGDTLDCHDVSRFKKDPKAASLQQERSRWYFFAEEMNEICPGARKIILRGNHDARFESWLAVNPEVSDLEELNLDSFLYLEELGFDPLVDVVYVNPRGDDEYPDPMLVLQHGETARSAAGSSVKAASDEYAGTSVIVGHAHRSAVYTRRTIRGMSKSYEVGTLGTLEVDYDGFTNWSQSVLTGMISPDYFDFQLHMIDRGNITFNGMLLRGRK